MKVAELKNKLQAYKREHLESIIVGMYKAIPRSVKETAEIDSLISDPGARHVRPRVRTLRDIDDIAWETDEFISDAYNQYYFAPNSVVPKSKRPGWRFTARRLFKELNQAADSPDNAPKAADLLKKLYEMLCYSCDYILFSGSDSFDSVGIRQVDFFQLLLAVKRRIEPVREFVRDSILLALANSLNRTTLREDLLEVIVAFLDTVDLKEMAIEICDQLRKEAAANRLKHLHPFSEGPNSRGARNFVNHLAIMGWMCHMALDQPDDANRYYWQHQKEASPEIALYVLLRMLRHRQCWNLWLRAYQEAVARGIQPREELQRQSGEIREKTG